MKIIRLMFFQIHFNKKIKKYFNLFSVKNPFGFVAEVFAIRTVRNAQKFPRGGGIETLGRESLRKKCVAVALPW
jgi:hypothetical protein